MGEATRWSRSTSANAFPCGGAATGATRSPPASPPCSVRYSWPPRLRRFKCQDGKSGRGGGTDREAEDWRSAPLASPYQILGVDPSCCSPEQLKAAFRARVKEFHPDVCKDTKDADALIKRVIRAYEILTKTQEDKHFGGRVGTDPFEEPECEAYDLFVNELQCMGKGCPYSCVKMAPHAFTFAAQTGTAHAFSQGHGDEDYNVHLAVGQCPRRCIHYVTPGQRQVLEDLLQSALSLPYDLAEVDLLESLISKARFENSRYQKPKVKPKASTQHVDWV